MKIFDNFLSDEDFDNLLEGVTHDLFPWYWGEVVSEDSLDVDPIYNYQLQHTFFNNGRIRSDYFKYVVPILEKLDVRVIHRVKINSNPMAPEVIEHGFHVDNEFRRSSTAIFYLNDNDGYTKFECGEKVKSVANRLVLFDTDIEHTGTTCTNAPRRIVMSINFIGKRG